MLKDVNSLFTKQMFHFNLIFVTCSDFLGCNIIVLDMQEIKEKHTHRNCIYAYLFGFQVMNTKCNAYIITFSNTLIQIDLILYTCTAVNATIKFH